MDAIRFDGLVRSWRKLASRREVTALPGGLLLGSASARVQPAASKKKKKVTLCLNGLTVTASSKKKKKLLKQGATLGSCPPTGCKPNCAGKTCGNDGCGGACGTCEPGGSCQGGQCVCLPDHVCGAGCCPATVECFAEGCACEQDLCSCSGGRTFCSTPDFTQCCASGDTCDPVAACTTNVCTAENDVCTVGGAFCGAGFCLCTTSAAGAPFCADFNLLTDCPTTGACATDTDCDTGETCANVPCCSATADAFVGVCLPACPVTRGGLATAEDRATRRRQLQRTLYLDRARPHPAQ
ncbi:MAG: hypothetical protein U0075_09475 [Thermomicrobiales bacterium]